MTTVLLHEARQHRNWSPAAPAGACGARRNHGLNRVRHVMRTAVIVLILAVFGGLQSAA